MVLASGKRYRIAWPRSRVITTKIPCFHTASTRCGAFGNVCSAALKERFLRLDEVNSGQHALDAVWRIIPAKPHGWSGLA